MKRLIVMIVALMAAIAVTAPAEARSIQDGYYIDQREAETNVLGAAETKYAPWGVIAEVGTCKPQGAPRFARYRGFYHRWTCHWEGVDYEDAEVFGFFRITGHSGHDYGYLAVLGGIGWR